MHRNTHERRGTAQNRAQTTGAASRAPSPPSKPDLEAFLRHGASDEYAHGKAPSRHPAAGYPETRWRVGTNRLRKAPCLVQIRSAAQSAADGLAHASL